MNFVVVQKSYLLNRSPTEIAQLINKDTNSNTKSDQELKPVRLEEEKSVTGQTFQGQIISGLGPALSDRSIVQGEEQDVSPERLPKSIQLGLTNLSPKATPRHPSAKESSLDDSEQTNRSNRSRNQSPQTLRTKLTVDRSPLPGLRTKESRTIDNIVTALPISPPYPFGDEFDDQGIFFFSYYFKLSSRFLIRIRMNNLDERNRS